MPLLYGGTYTLFAHQLPSQGIEVRFAKDDSAAALGALIDDNTAAVFCETIGNPAGNIPDLEAITAMAHKKGVPVIVDNTVPTPVLMKPIEFGADIVVHSLTKYMGGHGNSIGGLIVDSGKFPWAEHKARFPMLNNPEPAYHGVVYTEALGPAAYIGRTRTVPLRNTGSSMSPFNAFLFLQGIETLALRMERHVSNAMAVADHLEKHPAVKWVSYAGLKSSPYYQLAQKYTEGPPVGAADLRHQGRLRGGHQVLRRVEDLQAAGQHRRRQVTGRPPRIDHTPSADGGRAEGRWSHARHDSSLRRDRGHRRHPRGHQSGARGRNGLARLEF